jgi:hypothetical protein
VFNLSDEQNDKLKAWIEEQNSKVAEHQKEMGFSSAPYYGCSGGAYTYSFTPTTLGMVVKVKNNLTKDEIDLTNYKDW